MTHFDWRNEIGDAGERRVESFVREKLRFGYRKVGHPDIGIDGEIEIAVGPQMKSSGGFLKVQVKTTEASLIGGESFRYAIDESHLDYFASLVIQPVLVIVSLADEAIWWRPLLHKSHYAGPRGGFGITFHTGVDRLTTYSAVPLRMLGDRSNAMIAQYIIKEVEERLDEMDLKREQTEFDWVTTGIWGDYLVAARKQLRDADCLLRYERRYTEEITDVEVRYSALIERISLWKRFFQEYDIEDQYKDSDEY